MYPTLLKLNIYPLIIKTVPIVKIVLFLNGQCVGLFFFGMEDGLERTAAEILVRCVRRNLTMAAAESCTGGLVASSLVSVSGASGYFRGSLTAYCDDIKADVLGVRRETLEKFYAESPECSREMAECAARLFSSDIAVSTTGFLDANVGFRPKSLAGCVFVSVWLSGRIAAERRLALDVSLGRNANRRRVAAEALDSVLSLI